MEAQPGRWLQVPSPSHGGKGSCCFQRKPWAGQPPQLAASFEMQFGPSLEEGGGGEGGSEKQSPGLIL